MPMLNQRLSFIKAIFEDGCLGDDFTLLVSGQKYINLDGRLYNTGIIKSRHLVNLLEQHSYIRWTELTSVREHVRDRRIRYLLHIIDMILRVPRLKLECPIFEGEVSLLYITDNPEAVSPFPTLIANTRFSYALPALYTSGYQEGFSECTIDVFKDRYSEGIFYDKGLEIKVDNSDNQAFFYIDRKQNMSLLAAVIDKVVSGDDYSNDIQMILNSQRISELSNEIKQFSESMNSIDYHQGIERIIAMTNKMRFSFFGYLLFEIIHEYLVRKGYDIFTANQVLRIISPDQFTLWSMRKFSISNYRELRLKMFGVLKDFDEDDFARYVVNEFSYRLPLFTGDRFEHLHACLYVSMYSEAIHCIEISARDLSVSANYVPQSLHEYVRDCVHVEFQMLGSDMVLDEENLNLFLELMSKIPHDQVFDATVREMMREHELKKSYQEIRDLLKRLMLEFRDQEHLGTIFANLQPDDRGEYMLMPGSYDVKSFLLDRNMHVSSQSDRKILCVG